MAITEIGEIMESKTVFYLISLMIVCFNPSGVCQEKTDLLVRSNLSKYFIKTDSLIKYDNLKLLDFKRNIPVGDSIATLYFRNKLYFLFWAKESKGEELFTLDLNSNELFKVTNRSFSTEDSRLYTITSFNNKLFLTTNFSETEHVWNFGMLLIDHENNKEERYIPVKEKSLVREIFIHDDSLYIVLQPTIAKLNPFYFLTFWLPRERGMKYEWIDNGPIELFIYDKNFNLVRREEVPDYDLFSR